MPAPYSWQSSPNPWQTIGETIDALEAKIAAQQSPDPAILTRMAALEAKAAQVDALAARLTAAEAEHASLLAALSAPTKPAA